MRGNGEDRGGERLRLEVPADVAARPANFMVVTHSPFDFTLDFAQVLPAGGDTPRALVTARVVVSPQFVRRILDTLQRNLAKYEETFGPVRRPTAEGEGE